MWNDLFKRTGSIAALSAALLLSSGGAAFAVPTANYSTICAGSCSSPYSDSYGSLGETTSLSGSFVQAYLKDDKADGNGAYEFDDWLVPSTCDGCTGYTDWDNHQTADIGTADGRVSKYWSVSLDPISEKMRVITYPCVDLSFRWDICANSNAIFTFEY